MSITLAPNTKEPLKIDGVPPGSEAVEFHSSTMWDKMDAYLSQRAGEIGVNGAQNEIMDSLVKGLKLEHDPKALALAVPTQGFGQVVEDGREIGAATSAGIAAAQQQTQNQGLGGGTV